MDREMLMKFKTMFEAEKRSLLYSNTLNDVAFHVEPTEMKDEVDLTAMELEQSMRMRLRNREALFLKKIEAALAKIKAGSFGHCEDCGDEIELKRLEARPTASVCVLCKESQERIEKLHIDGHRSKSVGARVRFA